MQKLTRDVTYSDKRIIIILLNRFRSADNSHSYQIGTIITMFPGSGFAVQNAGDRPGQADKRGRGAHAPLHQCLV